MQAQDSSDQTGVVAVSGRTSSKELTRARERKADSALALKLAGSDWATIAATVGYPTPRAALVAVEKALERRLDTFDREQLRQVASNRLESLLRSTWVKAHDPDHPDHLAAVKESRGTVDRWIKLLGLDAPTEVVITSPTQEQIDQWVARVVSNQLPSVQEYDIVEADILEDDDAVSAQ